MNIIIIANSLIPSVLLCGHYQLLRKKEEGKIDYQFLSVNDISSSNISNADIIIYLRSDSELEAYVSKIAKKANKRQIYVLDDDLLNAPDYLSGSSYYNRNDVKKNMRDIMSNCDIFLSPSNKLIEKYGSLFKYAFKIEEPSMNVVENKSKNTKVKIGFAGSIDRTKDLNIILEKTLEKLIKQYPNEIEIEFMGAKPDIVDKYNLKHIPYQDSYQKYNEILKDLNWDIGLAPMPISDFHACKYINKYVEYASFGIVGVYSNCLPYLDGIKNAYNGLLVDNNEDAWFKAISNLIEDEKLREELRKNSLNEAKTIYSIEQLSDDYYKAITHEYEVITRSRVRGLFKYKAKCFYNKVINKVKEQGFKLPIWAFNKLIKIIKGRKND